MSRYQLINELEKAIIEIYRIENLKCLRGDNADYQHYGINIFSLFNELKRDLSDNHSSIDSIYDDLIYCSDEIMYFTANAFLYKPYLIDPSQLGVRQGNEVVYIQPRKVADKRYNMFTDAAYEKLYNYWDRLGDLIETFFTGILKPRAINFKAVLEEVKKKQIESDNFNWLLEFKENEYQEFNNKRLQIVHYETSNTKQFIQHIKSSSNLQEVEQNQFYRLAITDDLKTQIEFAIVGFIKTIEFLKEVKQKSSDL